MNISAALQLARQQVDRLDAEALLAHVLEKDRTWLHTWPEAEIAAEHLHDFQQLITQRANGQPLAYLTGRREFWSLSLEVNPATLIPRPETELLVEKALARIPTDADWRIADLGTGSGAIALAIASERPRCHLLATDNSSATLNIARRNATRLGLENLEFRHGDWHEALHSDEQFQLIVSNPPYIDEDDEHLLHNGLPYEPRTALTPGKDGLAAIRIIIANMAKHLSSPGWLLLEHGYQQAVSVRTLFQQQGYTDILSYHDLSDNERMTLARRPNQ